MVEEVGCVPRCVKNIQIFKSPGTPELHLFLVSSSSPLLAERFRSRPSPLFTDPLVLRPLQPDTTHIYIPLNVANVRAVLDTSMLSSIRWVIHNMQDLPAKTTSRLRDTCLPLTV